MTPLSPSGALGFRDWQREQPWDGPAILRDPNTVHVGTVNDPAQDVSRWAYVAGSIQLFNAPVIVTFLWTMDQAGSIQVGHRDIVIDGQVANPTQIRIPNMGPWLFMAWTPLTGATQWQRSATLFVTNRIHPCELIPQNPVPVDQQAVAIPNATTITGYPTDLGSGAAHLWANMGAGGSDVVLQYETSPTVWHIFHQHSVPANTKYDAAVVLPTNAWRWQISNFSGAASSFYLTIVPSMTGAD